MGKSRRSRTKKVGLPPGSLVHIGEVKTAQAEFSLMRYDDAQLTEKHTSKLAELDLHCGDTGALWLNLYGLHDPWLITEVGRAFNSLWCASATYISPSLGAQVHPT